MAYIFLNEGINYYRLTKSFIYKIQFVNLVKKENQFKQTHFVKIKQIQKLGPGL